MVPIFCPVRIDLSYRKNGFIKNMRPDCRKEAVFFMENQFFAYVSRMKYITRWSLMHSARTETLSEHSLDVAVITHALCVIARRRFGKEIDTGAAVLLALYHDAAETITGDLPTPVKYASPALREAYAQVERSAADRLLRMLPQDFRGDFAPLLREEGEAGRLVKAADKLSALIKCMEEERMGNREFLRAKESTLKSLEELDVPEADVFLDEFLPAYSLTLDELES